MEFGCERCFKADAPQAYRSLAGFKELARPIDETHFIVRFAECPHCAQRCVIVTTEMIDWEDGEDPIYRSVLPLAGLEANELIAQGEGIDLGRIEALGVSRPHLYHSQPKGKDAWSIWSNGPLLIGPHD